MSIDIHEIKVGDKVVFSHPDAGWPHDRVRAKKYLTEGQKYTVREVEIHDWHTNIHLEEFPETFFNSVHFEKSAAGKDGQ